MNIFHSNAAFQYFKIRENMSVLHDIIQISLRHK